LEVKFIICEDEYPIAMDIETRLVKRGYQSLGISCNYNECIELLKKTQPEIVLLDINLEEKKGGFDIAKLLNKRYNIPFIFITAYSDDYTFSEALQTNPSGFINKPFTDKDLYQQIEIAINRNKLNIKTSEIFKEARLPKEFDVLTKREIEVANLLSQGLSDVELADKLFVSASTVRTHLRHVYDKLEVKSRSELISLMFK
jgi:DNA-binding NarL/FixJ family response regulator